MRRILVLLLISLFLGCIGGPSEEPAEKPTLATESSSTGPQETPAKKPSLLQKQVNAKEQFYGAIKLLPEMEGHDVFSVWGSKPPLAQGGVMIDYLAGAQYILESGEGFGAGVYKLRTGGRIWVMREFKELESREIGGNRVYIEPDGEGPFGEGVKWLESDIMYTVDEDGASTDQLLKYAEKVMGSTAKLDPGSPEYEWVLLYQYLPDPLEGEALWMMRLTKMPIQSIMGIYGAGERAGGELQYTLTVVPGDIGVVIASGEIKELSSVEDIQVGDKTAKAGYIEGRYKLIYVDEEKQIVIGVEAKEKDLDALKESMVKLMEAAMVETGVS